MDEVLTMGVRLAELTLLCYAIVLLDPAAPLLTAWGVIAEHDAAVARAREAERQIYAPEPDTPPPVLCRSGWSNRSKRQWQRWRIMRRRR